jgi:hypothetical protein
MEVHMKRFVLATAFTASACITPALADQYIPFHTPSKNIYCAAVEADYGTLVDCEVVSMSNTKPLQPKPSDCEQDWGSRFQVSAEGPAEMGCAGDTLRDPAGKVLKYGQSFKFATITCQATTKGLTCQNTEGHGFFLSKSKQRLF